MRLPMSALLMFATGVIAAPSTTLAQAKLLPPLPVLTQAEEIRLAESAAPRQISSRATVLVHGQGGLTEARRGTNGYVCFVEWFPRAATMWPVCYEPELARVHVALNTALERLRADGRAEDSFTPVRDSILSAMEPPRAGGLSYRLSPDMWTNGPNGKRGGPWMILVTAPNAKVEQLGFEAGGGMRNTTGPRFGVAGLRSAAYYWIDVEPLSDSTSARSEPGKDRPR